MVFTRKKQILFLVIVLILIWIGVVLHETTHFGESTSRRRPRDDPSKSDRLLKPVKVHRLKSDDPTIQHHVQQTVNHVEVVVAPKHAIATAVPHVVALEEVRAKKLRERKKKAHIIDPEPDVDVFQPPYINPNPPEAEAQIEKDAGFKLNRFNQYLSDRLPLRRNVTDVRHDDCKHIHYDISVLPKTSVILLFHNEARSTLMRTVWSVLDHSPPSLLQEVILIDDGSTLDWMKHGKLEAEARSMSPKIHVYRTGARIGLIRARVFGAQRASAPVITFLDSHCECVEGWLEPLLQRIHEDRTVVVTPVIDVINKDTFEYQGNSHTPMKGVFAWSLNFNWAVVTPQEEAQRKNAASPVISPTMAGGLFSMDKQFFEELGTYDMQMDVWGGENLEMSFRIWQCGGTLEIIPCSHVGHVFRDHHPYSFPGGDAGKTITKNLRRVAEVWMDSYKDIFYLLRPDALEVDYGDITDRVELRNRLQCMPFSWYLDNVYPEFFIPDPRSLVGAGALRNLGSNQCFDSMSDEPAKMQPGVFGCHFSGGNQAFFVLKKWTNSAFEHV